MSVAAVTATNGGEAGNGVKTDFDFSFKIFLATDLLVYVETAIDSGTYELQTYTAEYTVSFNTAAETGTVIFAVAPADGRNVLINRFIPLTQGSTLPLEGKFPAKVVEDALDRLTLIVQDLKLIVSAPVAPNLVEYNTGTYAEKPVGFTHWLYWYSTDMDQLELWVPQAARWFLVG
jgi:hypothetical protein